MVEQDERGKETVDRQTVRSASILQPSCCSFSDIHYSIHQYFDGKCTDDEILYHAEISRRQLREVLHDYDEYVSLFFHSSISTFLFRVTPWSPFIIIHLLSVTGSPRNHARGIRF